MRYMPEELWDVWESGNYAGDNFPNARVTIQKSVLHQYEGLQWRTLLFDQAETQYELPNVKTVRIDRRLQTDAAAMTVTLMNQVPIDVNANLDTTHGVDTNDAIPTIRDLKDLSYPGYYTFRRGVTSEGRERWGHDFDPTWVDMLIPNRVIRTFQGYGTDGAANPWADTRLVLTGIWLIDRVEYKTNGDIVITCRDSAKLLIEQRLYPPIIPGDEYPLNFCMERTEYTTEHYTTTTEETVTVEGGLGANVASHIATSPDSSVAPWYGYNATVYGHRASHAFDGDESTYWLSVGNGSSNADYSYEWIGADCNSEPVSQVSFNQKWGGYTCYVAVKEAGVWQGTQVVPYNPDSDAAAPNGSDIKYVTTVNTPSGDGWVNIVLPRMYNAQQVRVVFTNLHDSDLGTYQYRAAVYTLQCQAYTASSTETIRTDVDDTREIETILPGNMSDYTDIIKVLCAWSGFYWPWGTADPLLVHWESSTGGRVWGDFAYSGAYPVIPPCIDSSFWDNKSVMDGINQIKEILGFLFYIDSTGGVVFRMPNIWRTGNWITGYGFIGPDSIRDIDEEKVIIDYGVTIDDTNLRSEIIVVSSDDPTFWAAIEPGYALGETMPSASGITGDLSLLGGQQRILLVPNYPFISQDEVDKFAYLVSLWIHWSYRKGRVRIPGNPAFEPDDQVKLYERITSDSYIHYLQGVTSTMDLDAGTWFLDLDTHWLGDGPDANWIVNTFKDMPVALFEYLVDVGEIEVPGDESLLPDDWDPNYTPPEYMGDPPRLDTDLDDLFPDPPDVDYTIDLTWSDEDIADAYGPGVITPPSGSDSGEVEWRSEAYWRSYWGPVCSDLVAITLSTRWLPAYASLPPGDVPDNTHSGQVETVRVTVPRASVAAFKILGNVLADEGYNVKAASTGAYAGCDRCINHDCANYPLSPHAWGLAIDVNWHDNAVNKSAGSIDTDFISAAQRITSDIRTNNGKSVFGWGGNWNSKKDWMHFEVVVKKEDVLTGVYLR